MSGSSPRFSADALPLVEVLRKSHRDELLSLAEALGVNPKGLGLGKLAGNIEGRLRQVGGYEVKNVLMRKGEGPPYRAVLNGLAQRLKVAPADIEAETERRLLHWWWHTAWTELDDARRAHLWQSLGLDGPCPEPAEAAATASEKALDPGFHYHAGMIAAGGLARLAAMVAMPLFGPLMPIGAWLWMTRPKDDILLPAVMEVARLRQVLAHRVTVGVVGSPSSGKDAAIKAIFGIDSGNIDPVAGSTKSVAITKLPGATALYVVNTPGMGDVVEAVTEEAKQVLHHIDVFVYVVNAQGGVQARELADWTACCARGRPCLAVVNKIDTLRERDRERYLLDARGKLNAPEVDFLAAAFDPLPQLSEHPIGLAEVRAWLEDRLAGLGKDTGELPWRNPGATAPASPS